MKFKPRRIAIIGAGNVAWHLAPALENAGHVVTAVYARTLVKAEALAQALYNAKATDSLDFEDADIDTAIICIADDALGEVVDFLLLPEKAVVAHTSGSGSLEVLSRFGDNAGVFYPMQTFSRDSSLDMVTVPICLEASSDLAEKVLYSMANSISKEIYYLSSSDRRTAHLAAVFACNFTNHLLACSKKVMDDHDLNFELLHPLIAETVNKALAHGDPAKVQTGPAARGDRALIHRQQAALAYDERLQKLYTTLTSGILHTQGTNDD